MPGATVTIIYPSAPDATFDMDYYLSTHMPLVQKNWGPEGLRSWKIIKFPASSPYSVQATLEWPDIQTFQAAAGGESAKVVLGDVKNFSNKSPVIMGGEVVAESGHAL